MCSCPPNYFGATCDTFCAPPANYFSSDNACCPADDQNWRGSSYGSGCSLYGVGQSYHQYCNTSYHDGMEAAIHCPSACGCVQDCEGVWGGLRALDGSSHCVCPPQFDSCGVCDLDASNDNACCPADDQSWRGSLYRSGCSRYAIGQSYHQYCNTSSYDGMEAAIHCPSACGCVQDCAGVWGGLRALDGSSHCVCPPQFDSCGVCDLDASNDNACCPADDPSYAIGQWHYVCSRYAIGQSYHQYCNTSSQDGMEAAIHCPSACGCVQDCAGVWGGPKTLDVNGRCVCPPEYLDSCGVCDLNASNDNACCPADDQSWVSYDQRPYRRNSCSSYAIGQSYHQYCNTSSHHGTDAAIHCPSACGCVQDCEGVWGGPKTLDVNGRCVCPPEYLDSCGVCDTDFSNDNACCLADDTSWLYDYYNDCSDYAIGQFEHQYCNTSSHHGMEAAIRCPSACGCVQDCEGVWGGPKTLDVNGRCVCRPELNHCGACDLNVSNDNACCPPDDLYWISPDSHICQEYYSSLHQYCNTSSHDGMEAAIHCPSACGCVQDCAGVWGGPMASDHSGQCRECRADYPQCVQDCEGVWGGPKALDGSGRCVCRPEFDHCGVCDTDASNDNVCCPADDPIWYGGTCIYYAIGQFEHQYCNTSSHDGMEAAIHCPSACGCVQDCEGVWGGPKALDGNGRCVCRPEFDHCGVCDTDFSNDNACCPADDPSWFGGHECDDYGYHCVYDHCSRYSYTSGRSYHQYCNTSSHDGMQAAIHCPSACGCVQDCEGVWGGLKALDGSAQCVCPPQFDHCGVCDTDASNDNACCPADDPSWRSSSYRYTCSSYAIVQSEHQYCNTSSHDGMEAALHCPSACGCVQDCEGVWGGPKALDGSGRCVCRPEFDHCGVCDTDFSNDNACCPADDPIWQGSGFWCTRYASGQDYHQYCNTSSYGGMEAAIHCPSACGCVQDCEGVWGGPKALDGNGRCVCPPELLDSCSVCDTDFSNDNACCPADDPSWRGSSSGSGCSGYASGQSYHQYCNTSSYNGMEAALHCPSACGCD
eukprot:SAG25_NODE_14_length_24446_cov_22.033678_11_plen_1040_part_00